MPWSRSTICLRASAALAFALAFACSRGPEVAVVGESVKLRLGERRPSHSALWDGRTVRLRGARGETLGLQVLLRHPAPVTLELVDAPVSVQGFSVRALDVRQPSSSMYGKSRGPGVYPDILAPATSPVAADSAAFFDVALAGSARPGRYQGRLDAGAAHFPVELVIEPVTIDLQADPLVWVFYLPREIARAHGVPDDDGAAELAWEARYHALFRAHGAYLASDQPRRRFPARRGFVDGIRYWPVALDLASDGRLAADASAWLEAFRDLPAQPFAIPVDEPHGSAARRRVRHIFDLIGKTRLVRAVTDSPHPEYGDAVDAYFSSQNIPGGRRPFWAVNGGGTTAGGLLLDAEGVALRTWGWIAYRYGIELWYAWEGLYWSDRYNKGGPTDLMTNPVTFDQRRTGGDDWGNGDGVLAYPGPMPSLRLKALRRGLADRRLLIKLAACGGAAKADAIARRLIPRAMGEAPKGDEPTWPRDEAAWEAARSAVLDALVRRCPDVD
ncbi:MAG TPA: glycoside hydrolase domain-containing protein [Polyangia bacterium]|nr:glycoside hydrolase domain-containing protein [Polyangia bacterium]